MRRLAAISLLLIFLALSSSATSIACATNCAQMTHPASAMPGMDMTMEHSDVMPATQSFAGTHCAGHALRLLAQRVVTPPSPYSAVLRPSSAQGVTFASATGVACAFFAASPPGPALLPTQLRI